MMKKLLKTALIAVAFGASSLTIASSAIANSGKRFVSTFQTQTTPIKINVTLGEDLAYRAEHISKDIKDRRNTKSRNNGFSGNGFFGQRDLDRLTKRLKTRIEAKLEKNGIIVSDDATTVLNLVITDAKPNRPTFKQLSKETSLSYRSFGVGGAKFEGTLVSENGEEAMVSYRWYETNIRDAQYGGTWSDANRAIDRFASKTVKSLR